ncbi:MAG: DUF3990 domain-containing protein [Clostridia bacterium]|nr:DUF3990 domain-containing protein [Clostridia bacterium]
MSKQIVYHGSYCKVENPEIIKGKFTKHQIAFCTENSLECLKFIDVKEK